MVASATRGRASLGERTFYFMTAVVAIQGGHVVEHIVQLVQVSLLGVPEQDALGLLGYVLQFNGTEEWLHLGYNTFYLLALYALIIPLWRITPAVLPLSAFVFFITASVWLETWHMVEHGVIISNVIANGGAHAPGSGTPHSVSATRSCTLCTTRSRTPASRTPTSSSSGIAANASAARMNGPRRVDELACVDSSPKTDAARPRGLSSLFREAELLDALRTTSPETSRPTIDLHTPTTSLLPLCASSDNAARPDRCLRSGPFPRRSCG